jgi:hypothetical protein
MECLGPSTTSRAPSCPDDLPPRSPKLLTVRLPWRRIRNAVGMSRRLPPECPAIGPRIHPSQRACAATPSIPALPSTAATGRNTVTGGFASCLVDWALPDRRPDLAQPPETCSARNTPRFASYSVVAALARGAHPRSDPRTDGSATRQPAVRSPGSLVTPVGVPSLRVRIDRIGSLVMSVGSLPKKRPQLGLQFF